ncbi:hypothetical protein JXA32_16555 [Candidatus Sumerlaeota bacterium]|nr:hypothetical protein [Candidatus Sumerlaeota bacterium]
MVATIQQSLRLVLKKLAPDTTALPMLIALAEHLHLFPEDKSMSKLLLKYIVLIFLFQISELIASSTENIGSVLKKMEETHHIISRGSSVNTFETINDDISGSTVKEIVTLLQYDNNFLMQKELWIAGNESRRSIHSYNGSRQKNWNTLNSDKFPNGAGSFMAMNHDDILNDSFSKNMWMRLMGEISSGNWLRFLMFEDAQPIYQIFSDNLEKTSMEVREEGEDIVYVLQSETKRGDYYIEVNPQKSYNIQSARISRKRELGHFNDDAEYWEGTQERDFSFFDVQYELIGSTWIAVSAKGKLRTIANNKEYNQDISITVDNIHLLEMAPDIDQFDIIWPEGAMIADINADIVYRAGNNNILLPDDIDSLEAELVANIRTMQKELKSKDDQQNNDIENKDQISNDNDQLTSDHYVVNPQTNSVTIQKSQNVGLLYSILIIVVLIILGLVYIYFYKKR